MKKIIALCSLAVALLFAGNAKAQLGINVGYAPENFVVGDNSTAYTGLFAGVNYNYNLSGDINLSLGAQFRMNNRSTETTIFGVKATETNQQYLIDIPLLFNYGFRLSNTVKLSVFAGPTFSYALSGKTTYKVSGGSSSHSFDPVNWYGENSDLNQFNVSGTIGGAITFNSIRVFAGYNYGLMDLNKSDNGTLKTNGLFVGLGLNL